MFIPSIPRNRRLTLAMLVLSSAAAAAATSAEPLLWIESEQAVKKQLVPNAGLMSVDGDELSGGAWICSFSEPGQPTGTAEYALDIPAAGEYRFWLRAAFGSGILYRLDGGKWVAAGGKDIQPAGIAADGRWGFPVVAWRDLGKLDLSAGKHTLAFDLGGQKQKKRWAGIDCFVLTTGEFAPNGKFKPGQKPDNYITLPADQTWPFESAGDKLDPAAVLDLRHLNEKTAGEHGFIALSKDGRSFVCGDGQPIRFWGGSEYAQRNLNLDALKRHAQFLAKRGANIVRVHAAIQPKGKNSKITDVDEKELDQIFKLVVAMKSAGIYTIISPFWGTAAKVQKGWGVLNSGRNNAEPLLFFEPTLQKGYKAWSKALYTRPNPYGGPKLADEPAVAIAQIQNENSLLFWTASFGGEAMVYYRRLYADFLKKKYGSFEKARQAWKNYKAEWLADAWDKGLPGMLHVWDFTRDARAKKGKIPGFEERAADQLEFVARTMYNFNTDIVKYLRNDLGCKQLVNAGNWRTVDMILVQDAEYWSYTATDVIGRNFYTGGYHRGINEGWQILPGQVYTDVSMTRKPVNLPINLKQPAGRPMIVPETLWVPPDRYQSEGPLMVAAQTALNGVDVAFWFASGVAEWQPPMNKWTYATPMLLGQFPAAALIFRTGLVEPGKPAVVERRSLTNLWHRTTPIISEESGWDVNRDTGNIAVKSSVKTPVDPLAYLVGPVEVVYGGDPAKTSVIDLSKYIDRARKTVRSVTGQIETDYGKGLYRVNAPKAQAVAGFLGAAGPQKLADVDITCRNAYATVAIVPLDGKPIRTSAKVLVQIGTVCRPTGWTVRPARVLVDGKMTDGFRIITVGKSPWQVEKAHGEVTIRNAGLAKATVLDVNGMASEKAVALKRGGGATTVMLPPDALYLVLTAE